MPDKKIVDDYYASISSTSSSEDSEQNTKKRVVKAKKVMIKKSPAVSVAPPETQEEKKPLVKKKVSQEKIPDFDEVKQQQAEEEVKETSTEAVKEEKKSEKPQKFINTMIGGIEVSQNSYRSKKPGAPGGRGDEDTSDKRSKGKSAFGKKDKHKRAIFDDGEGGFVRSNKLNKRKREEKKVEDIQQNLVAHTGETVVVSDVLSLKELSEKIGVPMSNLIAEFMKNGMLVTINSKIDFDAASIVAEVFQVVLKKDESSGLGIQELLSGDITDLLKEDDTSSLVDRPPVISIMGHVDHGKTSLLDYIRKEKVAEGEAGGITQSIGAYQVDYNDKTITFLDTPGHEAFTVMRARGAKSTDIAILVVAADEGVKPQTIESINHAKEAGISVIVAINKMDKEGANPDHVKGQLSEHGLVPEDWGGDTPCVPVSARTGFGIDDLLEIILLVAEMKVLQANPDRRGVGTVIESHLDSRLGPVATVLMNTGTLNKTDNIVCRDAYGKVKILHDYAGKHIAQVGPGDPVLIVGLDKVVEGGDILQVVSDATTARTKSIEYAEVMRQKQAMNASGIDRIMSQIRSGNLKQLKIVLKADTNGSLEAIRASLLKLSTEDTEVMVIHAGVGDITEGDILMCEGSAAILIGFGVGVAGNAKNILRDSNIECINDRVIYHITERIEKIITGMLDPKEVETVLANAQVGGVFYTSKEFMILGLRVRDGETIESKTKVRVIRKDKKVGEGKITSLKQGVEEVHKIEGPTECGVRFEGNMKPEENDILEIYKVEIQK